MKRALGILLVLGVGFVLALGAAEVALRLLDLAPTRGLTTVTAAQFERLPGLFSPGAAFTDLRNANLPHRVRIDSLGLRGPDIARTPPAGTLRLAMLGDSFVYGDFVHDEETLPAQLQARLSRSCGPTEVINAGLPGSTITEQVEIARRILPLRPALVVITFTENDVTDLRNEPMWDQLARNRAAKSSFPLRYLYPMLRASALWNLAMQVRGRLRASASHDGGAAKAATDSVPGGVRPDSTRRAAYEMALATLATELRAAGVDAVYVTFPAHFTVYGEWTDEQLRWAEAAAARQSLPVVRTLPAMQASGKGATELFLLPHDGHPSALGYALSADTLAAELRARPALASRCGVTP